MKTLRSRIDGECTIREFRFKKTYDGTSGYSPSIFYAGAIEGARISGRWIVDDRAKLNGNFSMSRRRDRGPPRSIPLLTLDEIKSCADPRAIACIYARDSLTWMNRARSIQDPRSIPTKGDAHVDYFNLYRNGPDPR